MDDLLRPEKRADAKFSIFLAAWLALCFAEYMLHDYAATIFGVCGLSIGMGLGRDLRR